jgi:hypothetical protein
MIVSIAAEGDRSAAGGPVFSNSSQTADHRRPIRARPTGFVGRGCHHGRVAGGSPGKSQVAHLHVHSEHSVLDGACNIGQMAARAAELDMPALGLTDHGVMNGAVDMYSACREQGVKPILGIEAYYVDDRTMLPGVGRYERNHLTLLAIDDIGFRNLVALSSDAFLEGFNKGKAHTDLELLARYSEGVVALTGCLQSRFVRRIVERRPDEARDHLDALIQIFGPEQVYLEVQKNGIEDQNFANQEIAKIAREYDIPLWNFWAAANVLPNQGFDAELNDGFHLSFARNFFDQPRNMLSAWPWRNLTALQALDAVRKGLTQ